MSNDGHDALQEYPLDTDYCDVDNDTPSSDIARDGFQYPDDPDSTQPPPESDLSRTHDTEMGSGASEQIDEIIDSDSVVTNDGRSVTRTMFYPWDIDDADKADWYGKLAKLNDGMWDSKRDTRNKKADNDRWIDGFTSMLDSSDYVQDRVEKIIESVNLRHMATYSAQQTILATIELVERNERLQRGGTLLTENETFHELLDGVGADMDDMRNIRRLVREKSDLLEYEDY